MLVGPEGSARQCNFSPLNPLRRKALTVPLPLLVLKAIHQPLLEKYRRNMTTDSKNGKSKTTYRKIGAATKTVTNSKGSTPLDFYRCPPVIRNQREYHQFIHSLANFPHSVEITVHSKKYFSNCNSYSQSFPQKTTTTNASTIKKISKLYSKR